MFGGTSELLNGKLQQRECAVPKFEKRFVTANKPNFARDKIAHNVVWRKIVMGSKQKVVCCPKRQLFYIFVAGTNATIHLAQICLIKMRQDILKGVL